MKFTYKTGCGSVDWAQLTELYRQVGLVAGYGKKGDSRAIERAFRSSFRVVTAWHNARLIGAARALSDGVCNSTLFDVGVLPEFQKRGVGRGLMQALMAGLEHTRLYLTSTFGNEPFYRKLGFKRHKTAMAKYPFKSEYLEESNGDA
jgi:ribosomal protein S18 acetylase RimI-like enzyme